MQDIAAYIRYQQRCIAVPVSSGAGVKEDTQNENPRYGDPTKDDQVRARILCAIFEGAVGC
jgi:hypothetical protein